MKRLHFTVISIFILSLFVVPSYAIISPGLSYLANDQMMSQVLPSGKFDVSAKAEWWDAYDIYIRNTDLMMEPIHKTNLSYSMLSIPLRLSYGVTDNISLRLSTQFIKWSRVNFGAPHEWIGYGMGDSKVEILYQIARETADAPSMAVNIGADILTGKSDSALPTNGSDTSLATGLYAPNYYLSGIFGKKIGGWNGKAMLGYVVTSPYKMVPLYAIDPSDQIICSLCMSTLAGDAFEYGGEISAKFSGEDNRDTTSTNPSLQENSPITRISVAPFVVFHQSSTLSWKGVLEVPLAMKGNSSYADLGFNQYRGLNISIGAEMTI
jgi:hypothetical protein